MSYRNCCVVCRFMDYALENMREEDKGLQLKPKIQQIF